MQNQDFDYLAYALRQSQKFTEALRMVYKQHDHDESPSIGMVLDGIVKESEAMAELLLAVRMAKNNMEDKE